MTRATRTTRRRPGSTLKVGLGLVVLAFSVGCGTCEGTPQKQGPGAAADPDAEQPIPFAPSKFARPTGVHLASDAGVDM